MCINSVKETRKKKQPKSRIHAKGLKYIYVDFQEIDPDLEVG